MRVHYPFVCLLAMSSVGCGSKDKDKPKVDVAKERSVVEESARGIEKELPASLKGKLAFEAMTIGDHDDAVVVRPKDWKSVFDGNFSGPDELGFGTSYWVSSNCDGMCEAKDWAAVSDKVDFAQFRDGKTKVLKDEKASGERVAVGTNEEKTYIVVVRWKEGASRYFACRATLAKEAKEAADAFEKACRTLKIL